MVKDQNLENSKRPTLTESRKEIDLIDNTIHDLIMKRTEIVSDIATIKAEKKQASNKDALKILQPEREAAILRRLVSCLNAFNHTSGTSHFINSDSSIPR